MTIVAITDAGLAEIGNLKNLITLNLSGSSITDAGIAEFRGLSKLTMLWLDKTAISSVDSLPARIIWTVLNLTGTAITDDALPAWRGFRSCACSILMIRSLTDAGLPDLKRLEIWSI